MSKKAIVILAVALIAVAAVAGFRYFSQDKSTGETKNITVEVVHKDGTVKTFDITADAKYLADALRAENLIGDETYIKTLDGYTVDESVEEWWKLTKDGEMLNTGADTTPIADGDKFEITLNVGWGTYLDGGAEEESVTEPVTDAETPESVTDGADKSDVS